MTTLEFCVLLAETLALGFSLPVVAGIKGVAFIRGALCFLAPIVAILHLAVAGYRWQMIPVYLLAALLLAGLRGTPLPPLSQVAGVFLLAGGFTLTNLLPIFSLPDPGGRFPIGSMTFHLTDHSRYERMDPKSPRELMVQVWYPAQPGSAGPRAPYLSLPQPPSFKTAHLAFVRTHAILNAPVAGGGPFPVLLYSPSWRGTRNEDTFLVEMLAGHGYIVACIDHPYGSSRVAFPDGRLIRADDEPFLDASSDQAFQTGMRDAIARVRIRASDERFVLDELTRWNAAGSPSPFRGRLDIGHTGVFGFSFGGAVAAEACWMDSRFRAAMNLDGTLVGDAAYHGLEQPFLSVEEKLPPVTAADLASPAPFIRINARLNLRDAELARKYASYRVIIAGMHHMNFSDMPLYCRLRRFTAAGPIDPRRAMRIVNDYALAFFDKCLKGEPEPLFDKLLARYPEVDVHAGRQALARSR
jgi:predicted dienelactone hydrolase